MDENELKRWLTEEEWEWYSERGREVVSRKVTIFGVFCQSLAVARRDLSLAEQRAARMEAALREMDFDPLEIVNKVDFSKMPEKQKKWGATAEAWPACAAAELARTKMRELVFGILGAEPAGGAQ